MNNVKNQKGVTMISLVITIIVLVILSTMVTHTGISSIRNSRFERFKKELETVQSNVDLWYEKYLDLTFDEISIGIKIPTEKEESIKKQLEKMMNQSDQNGLSGLDITTDNLNRYRYFGKYEFENLQIDGIENDYIIDVKKRIAIVVDGYEFEGKKYYILDQIRNVVRGGSEVKETKKIDNITLDVYDVEMAVGNMKTIVANVTPSDATEDLVWISSNESIVSIQEVSGKHNNVVTIKATGTGKTSVTVMSRRGTTSVSCEIRVKEANVPKISNGMIPIKYNTETEKWVICSQNDSEWYNYARDEKKWANVMLCDGVYDTSTAIGTEVSENELGSMFVWIPRFAYKITEGYHTASNGKMSVVFLEGTSDKYHYTDSDGNVKEGTATRNRDGVRDENLKKYNDYVVHPCFTNGNGNYDNGQWKSELTGIWVAKFQAGIYTNEDDNKTKKTVNTNNTAKDLYYPIFKGRKYAYNYVTISQCYDLSVAMSTTNNPYGLATSANSHLIKNSEWGAVSYLSMSEYGYSNGEAAETIENGNNTITLNGNKSDIRNQKVYGITGYSNTGRKEQIENIITISNLTFNDELNGTKGRAYAWNNVESKSYKGKGTESSTTGNIYGIYDMGGTIGSYLASYVKGGELTKGASFATNTSTHLATAYSADSANNKGIFDFNNNYNAFKKNYGDAMYEISYRTSVNSNIIGWFGDKLEADDDGNESFFARGGVFWKNLVGMNTVNDDNGDAVSYLSFRCVLSIE